MLFAWCKPDVTPDTHCCNPDVTPDTHVRASRLSVLATGDDFDHIEASKKDKDAEVEYHIFNWLDWAPPLGTPCYHALHKHFPGALPGPAVHTRIQSILGSDEHGFKVGNTLFGASICPDEINNKVGDLADLMKTYWGNIFPLGGISGASFVGATGFKAFSAHVPDNGDIIILFGPHVGISADGEVGKVLRDGQHTGSTACGAVIGAYKACSSQIDGGDDFNEIDMQMGWIKAQIEPHVARIKAQSNPMSALAYQAYQMVKAKLEMIVNTDFGNGRLALVGGIQINMPSPYRDHFLPLTFDVHQNGQSTKDLLRAFECNFIPQMLLTKQATEAKKAFVPDAKKALVPPGKRSVSSRNEKEIGEKRLSIVDEADFTHWAEKVADDEAVNQHAVFAWLTWSPPLNTACYKTLHREFPGALPGPGVYHRANMILAKNYGFTPENTLFGNSICSDEINNTPGGLSALMSSYWGAVFPMGGIGGMPFAGKTGFKAFSHHVPDNGNIVILYGPHVGISQSGEVGKYLRKGQTKASTACGAVIGAYHASLSTKSTEDAEFDETDMQMGWIKAQVKAHCARIREQDCPMAALAYQAFELVRNKINKVVDTEFGSGRLVLIGGLQINLEPPYSDHFLPMSFEVRQAGKPTEDIKQAFHVPMPMPEEELESMEIGAESSNRAKTLSKS